MCTAPNNPLPTPSFALPHLVSLLQVAPSPPFPDHPRHWCENCKPSDELQESFESEGPEIPKEVCKSLPERLLFPDFLGSLGRRSQGELFLLFGGISGQETPERRQKFITKIHANLVFHACISFLRSFRTPRTPIRKILVYTGVLPCLGPSWPQMMQIRISLRSRSGC